MEKLKNGIDGNGMFLSGSSFTTFVRSYHSIISYIMISSVFFGYNGVYTLIQMLQYSS